MPTTQAPKKQNTKSKAKKALTIIICVILILAVAATIFIEVVTRPQDENTDYVAVGGMLTSDTVDFKAESAEGLDKNPIIKIMQMVWYFCAGGDEKKHAVQTPPDDVAKIKDVPYIDDGNLFHQLDVFYPENVKPGDKLPVIIDIHGGGWMYATKDLNEYYCLELAHRGYTVFSISYRLVPDVTVNEQIQDCAAALNWIGNHMSNYPCDTSNIMLTGDSAGGQLSIYSAVLNQSGELRKTFDTVKPNLDITALVLTSPVSYMKDGGLFSVYTKPLWGRDYKTKTTYEYMDLDEIMDYADTLPPTYLITSSGDTLAHDQTVRAYELLKEKGVACEIADYGKELTGKSLAHVFSILNPFDKAGQTAIDGELAFFEKTIEESK